ncbi:hypothetical protein PVAP13_3NG158700 [Panicum virgatum]|uniref:Uncharacterized protein n=1 Tax=Panicum virgatum TaxID=38727 RepID=A0A8T0UBV5_PANVG|nr:hypothetical protein PVAP13_3NG158700 [Panicum virgatum]
MRQKPRRPPPLLRKAADPSPSRLPASRATPARRQLQRPERPPSASASSCNDAGELVLRCQLAARPLEAGGRPATGSAAATGTRTGTGFGRRRRDAPGAGSAGDTVAPAEMTSGPAQDHRAQSGTQFERSAEGGGPFLFPITRAYAARQRPRCPPPLLRKAADPSPSSSPASRATPAWRQLQRPERPPSTGASSCNGAGEPVLRCQVAARPVEAGGGPARLPPPGRAGSGFGRRRRGPRRDDGAQSGTQFERR